MKNIYKSIIACCVGISGCVTTNLEKTSKFNIPETGLKIAVLADTQITTDLMNENYGFRSNFADKRFAEVAIRTPAQEYLAAKNLKHTLSDIDAQNPDLILYLGDGANSGCEQEVLKLFDALERSMELSSKSTPIFYVMGNHDYLATGNQSASKIRQGTCGEGNPFLSKAQMAAKISKFNRKSFEISKENKRTNQHHNANIEFLSYKDNLSSDEIGKEPYTICDTNNPDIQHYKGCFYASIIEYKSNNLKGQILLTDTSDYREVKAKPECRKCKDFALYGLRGSMSWGEAGQVNWFVDEGQKMDEPNVKIIASHYPIQNLAWNGLFAGRHGKLLSPKLQTNLWLSAHSHSKKLDQKAKFYKMKFSGDPNKYVLEYNTGSTTDYIPHFDMVQDHQGSVVRTSYPIFDGLADPKIRKSEIKRCQNKIESIDQFEIFNSPIQNKDSTDPYFLLGLKKHYQKANYKAEIARDNIENFLISAQLTPNARKDFEKCMMLIASKNEQE